MFDTTSRYANIETATLTVSDPDGQPRAIRYVKRRFIPPVEATTTLVEHAVTQGERLDNVTARYLTDPTQFWRVADANNALAPNDLTDDFGRRIIIPLPLV